MNHRHVRYIEIYTVGIMTVMELNKSANYSEHIEFLRNGKKHYPKFLHLVPCASYRVALFTTH